MDEPMYLTGTQATSCLGCTGCTGCGGCVACGLCGFCAAIDGGAFLTVAAGAAIAVGFAGFFYVGD